MRYPAKCEIRFFSVQHSAIYAIIANLESLRRKYIIGSSTSMCLAILDTYLIHGIGLVAGLRRKWTIFLFILAPRLGLSITLSYAGTMFLAETTDVGDIILNASAWCLGRRLR